jgi:serine/threonine protein kinase
MPAPRHPSPAAHPGQRFTVGPHTYCAVRMLGRNGVSERFLARAEASDVEGALVVLKRLQDTRRTDDRERFLEEARLLGLLNHPSIPRILAVASRAQRPLVVVEPDG